MTVHILLPSHKWLLRYQGNGEAFNRESRAENATNHRWFWQSTPDPRFDFISIQIAELQLLVKAWSGALLS